MKEPELQKTTNGFYIPMDGPWQSEEDNAAFALAERTYSELSEKEPYVRLIQSFDPFSHGYWIELRDNKLGPHDLILKQTQK